MGVSIGMKLQFFAGALGLGRKEAGSMVFRALDLAEAKGQYNIEANVYH